jgi:predicted alpha-1,2-mannosidase
MKLALGIFLLLLVPSSSLSQSRQPNLTRLVDPFVGTGGHGHTFPGATLPFGMVQLSPDTRLTGWDGCSGYHYSDHVIYGFSHTHLSGTGISDYGDILLMPTVGEIQFHSNANLPSKGYASEFSHKNEIARPGYYSVRLDDDKILAELTATSRVGLHRYTFPKSDRANIILDLVHRDRVRESYLHIVDNSHVVGFRRSEAWAKDQIVYFALEFSRPFNESSLSSAGAAATTTEARGDDLKAAFRFSTQDNALILVKVGISAVSIEGARANLQAEINHWDFERVRADADRIWNTELGKIIITGGNENHLRNFYTALYHSMLAPNLFMDVDRKYRGRDFKTHTAKDFDNYTVFSLWDTFRAAHPLYTIIDQQRTRDFINTFLTQYEQGGRLPVWELSANETDTMIGYHAVSVIADAAAKDIDGFDRRLALKAMKHSAEQKHFGLDAYADHGFMGMEEERESVSKTLEYAYDDWCIAELARREGQKDDYERFSARAQNYKNVFDPSSGFMRPRSNGKWLTPFDPHEVDFNFTEANSWQYTFFVPQDISGLIALMGGKPAFVAKLDALFAAESKTTGREQLDITGLIGQYAHGNEPSHHMAYLYNYANQPWKTQLRVRQIMDNFYRPTPDGLIGNEDCGQMSAWFVLSAAGFYPVTPGDPIYAIGSPLFPQVRFNLENGKSFVIKARRASKINSYIQSATLNGRPYSKSFITHKDLMAGGELIFEMGRHPNRNWGSNDQDVPVSRISASPIVPVPVIHAVGKTFKDFLVVSLAATGSNLEIHYTTDGSEPSIRSTRFTKSLVLDKTSTVKAVAIDSSRQTSLVATAKYVRIPHAWKIALASKYSGQYNGGGDLALIDGIRGTSNWSGGGWQGYQGQDLVATIDLGQVQKVSRLSAGFLQDIRSWIWMPRRVEFEVSDDGQVFRQVASIPVDVAEKEYGVIIRDFGSSVDGVTARYVRIRAQSYGKLPAWHLGSGGDSWIFVDEIIVE